MMEIKRNEATRNRPEGDRVIDAPYVFANLPALIEQIKEENAWDKSDRNGITVFKTPGMTMVLSALKEGAVIKDNTVNGFLTVQLLKGTIRMATLDGDNIMEENHLVSFHPQLPHSIEALTNAVLLITTYDIKE